MSELAEFEGSARNTVAAPGSDSLPGGPAQQSRAESGFELTRAQKAAVILGILGTEAAGPILERMDEESLRSFASAMSRLRRI